MTTEKFEFFKEIVFKWEYHSELNKNPIKYDGGSKRKFDNAITKALTEAKTLGRKTDR